MTPSLNQYQALIAQEKLRPLTPEERAKLDFLADVLLELGALPAEGDKHPVRTPRVAVKLEVSFSSREAITQSYARDIGTGGIAITTDRELSIGDSIDMQVRLPGEVLPLAVRGTVAWKRDGMVGVSFTDLEPTSERRLKSHLLTNDSLLQRVRASLDRRRGPLPVAAKTITPTSPEVVEEQPPGKPVLVRLLDANVQAVVIEMLHQLGLRAFEAIPRKTVPVVAAIEPGVPESVLTGVPSSLPVICVNVSGPDALVGWLPARNTVAFVRRKATAASIVNAVEEVLKTLG